MHRMGFEPMKLSLSELESDPLDHSGTCAIINILYYINNYTIYFYLYSF